jgi:hypothetical protein
VALDLSGHVIAGELFNTRPYSTHGWLALRGERSPMIFQLTGNCSAELQGKHLRFSIPEDRPLPPAAVPLEPKTLAWQQVGPTEALNIRREGARTVLHLAWQSQNGDVVVELVDPELEWVDDEKEDQAQATADAPSDEDIFISHRADDEEGFHSAFDVPPPDADALADDPYELFPPGLDAELTDGEDPFAVPNHPPAEKRPWDEVIPGLDPETKRMYEEWDEVTDGSKDVPFSEAFDPAIVVYTPEQLDSLADEAVETALKQLLARLALLGVAVAVCEHFTPRLAYRMIVEEILPSHGVHPRLPQIGWVQHYDTSEFCRKCEEKFDREFEEYERERGENESPPE